MELYCTPRAYSCLPHSPIIYLLPRIRSSLPARPRPFLFSSKSLSSLPTPDFRCPGAVDSEVTSSTAVSEKFEISPATKVEEASYDVVPDKDPAKAVEQRENGDFSGEHVPVAKAVNVAGQNEIMDFFSKLDLKLDSVDSYYIILYGAGALIALRILFAIVGAIDSIPLFPKLLQFVGIGYSTWFSYQYLIFKESREDLFAKIQDLKEHIFGQPDSD